MRLVYTLPYYQAGQSTLALLSTLSTYFGKHNTWNPLLDKLRKCYDFFALWEWKVPHNLMFYDITWSVQSFHVDKFLLLCILDSRKSHPTVFSVQCIKQASNTVCSRCVTFCPRMLLLCLRCTWCTAPEWCSIDAHGALHQNARDTMYVPEFH